MRPFFLLLILPAIVLSQESKLRLVRETEALSPDLEQTKLHAPEGFEIQLFASEPMINKPINMAFDAKGRLWVSSTVEYPYAAKQERWMDTQGTHVRDSRDAIKILEDTNGDGRADKVTDFADELNIPTGVVPWHKPEHKAGCIAWSIPNIWYFADTDGDGKADLREVLFGPLGYEKDTHGMCSSFRLGPDGWVYATHGFSNTSRFKVLKKGATTEHTDNTKKKKSDSVSSVVDQGLELHSGNVFRFRPDGSAVELYSAGQVNPFGLCWDRHGNLYSADCHSNPITQLLRGAHYPSFGKPHDGLGFAPNMCEHSHGSTGLCGIIYIDGDIWGPEWDDHMLLGNCVTSKVNHDKITFAGSTPKANEQPDFITSDDPWFRPVDLQLGTDNALYIADFYNKIIGHYEVPLDHPGRDKERGRIWRVAKKDAAKTPRLAPQAPVAATLVQLSDADPFVVRSAAAWFAEHPALESLPALLNALDKVAAHDAQLCHQLRIALREHLKLKGVYASVPASANEKVSEVSFAVPSAEAAGFLLTQWPAETTQVLSHLARHGDEPTLAAAIVKAHAQAKDMAQAVTWIEALHNGLLERGGKPPASLLAWATETAESLLGQHDEAAAAWESMPINGGESPWCLQERKGADGKDLTVISSLNRDLKTPEKRTGILRSQRFTAPAKLSFWLCGHQGFPAEKGNEKNLVRLMDIATQLPLKIALAPRTDVAQHIEWDLAHIQDKAVQLEIVDGDNGDAYAWLGVGRFDHEVVSTQTFSPTNARQKQLNVLAMLLRTTAPIGLRDRLNAFLPKSPKLEVAKPEPEMEALLAARRAGFAKAKPDVTKGELLFTANCAACHSLGGKGGLIGPQLDGIGHRGADRLIEDILDPNRNVDAHFHLHQITLRDGSAMTGFVRGEAGQVIILADAAGHEQRIAKGDIVEDKELPQSLMPPSFAQTIPADALNDLIGWLLQK